MCSKINCRFWNLFILVVTSLVYSSFGLFSKFLSVCFFPINFHCSFFFVFLAVVNLNQTKTSLCHYILSDKLATVFFSVLVNSQLVLWSSLPSDRSVLIERLLDEGWGAALKTCRSHSLLGNLLVETCILQDSEDGDISNISGCFNGLAAAHILCPHAYEACFMKDNTTVSMNVCWQDEVHLYC